MNGIILQPKKFVGLHSHSTFSIGDAIGRPEDHIEFAIKNGMDALALTDHGNMNGLSHQYLYWENKLKKSGSAFRPLYGNETYFVSSLKDWQTLYDSEQQKKSLEREEKKKKQFQEKVQGLMDPFASTKEDLVILTDTNKLDENLQGDTGVENESESKSNRWKNPLYQRNHLVLLPKNSEGLKALFACTSYSFIDGYYRYPRMDFEILEKHAKGNLIALSACVGGFLAKIVFDNQETITDWEQFKPNDENFEKIQKELSETVSRFQHVLGKENFYIELQQNSLSAQHLVNYHLIECSKRTGAQLVTTVDAHYSHPDHWREREIYRAMARLQFNKKQEVGSKEKTGMEVEIPKSIDELKCELYPKNAEQVWESFLRYSKEYDFYDHKLVAESIERTHDIAHNQIDKNIQIDKRIKLPSVKTLVDKDALQRLCETLGDDPGEDAMAFAQLKKLVLEGARWRQVDQRDEYIQRLKTELTVIKHLNFSKYFLTYYKVIELISKKCLIGIGRGSAGSSAVAFVLGITNIDPIKHNLLFSRFLTPNKKGNPDIDIDVSDRDVALKLISEFFGEDNVIAVSNFNQLQMRSLIKDACRVNGVTFEEANEITQQIEAETKAAARQEPGFDATQWFLTYEAAENDSVTFRNMIAKYPELEKTIKVLFKNNRNLSRHAGGVIITENARENMPIVKSGGVLQTPWTEGTNYRHLEAFGFLKFDILGLGTLRMFESCIKRIIKNKQGIKYPTFEHVKTFYQKNLIENSLDDIKVYKHVYWKKNFAGIFQFVRPQVQEMVSKIKPTCIGDLSAITSLFRPGPLCLSGDSDILIKVSKWGQPGVKKQVCQYKTIEQLYREFNFPLPHGRYKYDICSIDEKSKKIISNKIVGVCRSGKKEVYEIEVRARLTTYNAATNRRSRGPRFLKIKSTLDHRFLTIDGWKRLKDIVPGEYLLFMNRSSSVRSRRKGILGERNFNNIAFKHYRHKCIFCNWQNGSLDVNHVNGNRYINNSANNLCFVCPNHHREITEGTITEKEVRIGMKKHELPMTRDIRAIKYLDKRLVGVQETYDIEVGGPNHNFIAGGFVVHNSIGAEKIYLRNRKNSTEIEYRHPLLKEVLEETSGIILYQEQLQQIYHKLAGVPLDETDDIRKAFTKKEIANREESEKERRRLCEEFVVRCKKVNDIPEHVSTEIFEEMEKYTKYSFNKSHSFSYSIISYFCSWLLTYYPEEWIATYVDYCIEDKGKVAGYDDPKAVALGEVRALGYNLTKADINLSDKEFAVKDQTKELIPSFGSIKGIGSAAQKEIYQYRPYNSIEDLLWNSDALTWRHSKFNKKAMSSLIKLEALDSMGLVGTDKPFQNYRQLHHVVVDSAETLKRAISRKKNKNHKEVLESLISEAKTITDWSSSEKMEFAKELLGSIETGMIVTPEVRQFFEESDIKSIDDIENQKTIYWAIAQECKFATTKTGKKYCRLKLLGDSGVSYLCFVWNFIPGKDVPFPDNSLIVGSFKKSDFGLSASFGKLSLLNHVSPEGELNQKDN
jgi:DNA polymerase III alpha subunit